MTNRTTIEPDRQPQEKKKPYAQAALAEKIQKTVQDNKLAADVAERHRTMQIDAENALLQGFLTKEKTAALLGKSVHTLDRWHRLRIGPPRVKLGSTVLYRKESLRAWLIAQEQAQLRG